MSVEDEFTPRLGIRVAFATNDERTAKRISDALGAKTELRSQKNYTGHRLSPWLSHMMVSRQETQRALMTPGEVMQMPVDKEVVMISGMPPILAKKLRYFKDRNFLDRVIEPMPVCGVFLDGQSDWIDDIENHGKAGDSSRTTPDEGGRDQQPELGRIELLQVSDVQSDVSPEQDEGIDPMLPDTALNLRRAATLGETDDRMLPGF